MRSGLGLDWQPEGKIAGDSSGAVATRRKPGWHPRAYHQAQLAPVPTALQRSEARGAQHPQGGILQCHDPPDPLGWAW